MSNVIKLIFSALLIAMLLYAASGYYSASRDVAHLKQRARTLIDAGRGGDALGTKRIQLLLLLQDPNFYNHQGVDLKTAGAGLTTITQSLSKRLAFNNFNPGIGLSLIHISEPTRPY